MSMEKRTRALVDVLIVIVITVALVNLCSYIALLYIYDVNPFDNESMQKFRNKFYKNSKNATFPHPYIGLVGFNDIIYQSPLSTEPVFDQVYISPKSPHDVKVLILGGSVAMQMSKSKFYDGTDMFAKKLNERFHTDIFSVYSAARGGIKQPQQYLKLIYLDLLGFRPDIVINYDGFNEIVLPMSENKTTGDPAIFPRSYSKHLESTMNRSCTALNNWFLNRDNRIPMVVLASYIIAAYCEYKINEEYEFPWWLSLYDTPTSEERARQSVAIWRNSSNKIYEFTKLRDIEYIHVLQPNQYYPDSKIYTNEENGTALSFAYYGDAVKQYYSLLSANELMAKNVLDQRYLFRNNDETLYVDVCCHLNKRGMEYIVDNIIATFGAVFERKLEGLAALPKE